jgi:hypothetical protein
MKKLISFVILMLIFAPSVWAKGGHGGGGHHGTSSYANNPSYRSFSPSYPNTVYRPFTPSYITPSRIYIPYTNSNYHYPVFQNGRYIWIVTPDPPGSFNNDILKKFLEEEDY